MRLAYVILLTLVLSACATTQPQEPQVVYVEKHTELPLPERPNWALENNTENTPLNEVAKNWAIFKQQALSHIQQLENIIKSTHKGDKDE